MTSSIHISVCVCTYNRSAKLHRLLENIVAENVFSKHLDAELLIIDNNSNDNTKQIVQSFVDKLPIKYFFEAEQGLTSARNCALKNSLGGWVLYTDDDVLLTNSWLSEYKKAIYMFPDARYMGGKIKPYWAMGKPVWLKDENLSLLSGVLVHYDLGENNFMYQQHHSTPYGASFAINKQIIKKVGVFNVDIGLKGHNIGRGDETEYLQRVIDAGYKGAYVGKSVCMHDADMERFSSRYMFRHGVQKGLAHAITNSNLLSRVSLIKEIMFIIKGVWQLLKGRRDRYYQCIINLGLLRGLRKVKVNKK